MTTQLAYYLNKLEYEIDSSDLKEILQKGEPVIVIDARADSSFNLEHIPNAINIPHREMNAESLSQLDKSVLCVTYCDGIGCNASTKGALNMAKHGFKVKELIGGLDWWKRDGYETAGTKESEETNISCGC